MDKLRYEYISPKTGANTFNPISFQRTTESDKLKLGAKKPSSEPLGAACHSPNIRGYIDVYNIFNMSNEKICIGRGLAAIRANKDYKEADKIRDELLEKGILIEDKDGKTFWKFK